MPSIGNSATEADTQRAITDWLALAGIPFTITDAAHVTINGVTKGRSKIRTGWPDITACLPPDGTLLAIECKSARGRLRPEQVETIAQLQDAGALTVVARSLEDVMDAVCKFLTPLTAFRDENCKKRFDPCVPVKLARMMLAECREFHGFPNRINPLDPFDE